MDALIGAPELSSEAAALVAERPVFDGHVDSIQRALDLGHDLGVITPGQLDLVRGRAGGLGVLVLVSWVDPVHISEEPGGAALRAEKLMGAVHELARRHPDKLCLVGDGHGLESARERGAIAGVCGIEGGHAIEQDLGRLERFFAHGLRIMTLVWNNHLPWIRSCQEGAGAGVPPGLSDFGRDVVRRMNQLGVVIDLSHAGERSFDDALEVSVQPVVASHSGCAALHAHPRNLSDRQLRALADQGGVVGIVFHPGFLDAAAREEEARVRAGADYRGLTGACATELFLRRSQLMQVAAEPLSAERVVEHIVHAAEIAGVEHVGLGSDFDGIERCPSGLEDASAYGTLAELLLRRGMSADEVRLVLGGNMRRVFEAAMGPGTAASGASIEPLPAS